MTQTVPDEAVLRKQVDRRQLQMIIAGLGEGIMLIDPVEGIVWANESALALHNIEELSALGVTSADYQARFQLKYRNNHPLTENQYPIDRLLAGDTLRDLVVEIGPAPDGGSADWRRTFKLRGFALPDSKGNPESYILVIEDITKRMTAEDRFERAFAANPAPAIICRLSDLRYVKVNQGFLEMAGHERDQVIGRSTYEVDVLENAAKRESAIAALRDGRTIPQMEAMLRMPDGTSKPVIVAGQPIEIGEENCMLFTFIDMEARRKAENELRQSEERFERSFRLTPIPTLLSAREGQHLLDINEAFVNAFGYTLEEMAGLPYFKLPIWIDAAYRRQLEREIGKTGSVRNVEVELQTKRAEVLDCLVSAETVRIQGQECILTVFQDITERKRTEVELVSAIEAVMQDASWFSRTIIEKLADLRKPERASKAGSGLSDLTPRELEILGFMCQGLNDAAIVKMLGVSRNTVRNHVARIYAKADVHSRAAAIVWARERGFTGLANVKPSASRSSS